MLLFLCIRSIVDFVEGGMLVVLFDFCIVGLGILFCCEVIIVLRMLFNFNFFVL